MASGEECEIKYDDFDEQMMEDDDDAWEETEQDLQQPAQCLFCEKQLDTPGNLFCHCATVHAIDFRTVANEWNLDCFGYIKIVNYVRSKVYWCLQIFKATCIGI